MDLLAAPVRSFLEIVRLGSVSQAARAVGLSQPAVTKQIRSLEAALGSPLIERHGRGVKLTPPGELFADFAGRGARVFEDFSRALAELSRGETGKLTLGAGVTTCVQHLPPWLREFRRRHPGIEINVSTGASGAVEEWVLSSEVDLGFVTSEPRGKDLDAQQLFAEEIVLVVEPIAARRQPVALDSLGLILFPKNTGFRQYIDQRLSACGAAVSVKMETDSVEAIKSFVTSGIGASFLPIGMVREELGRGTLARVRAQGLGKLERRTSLIWRRDRRQSFAMRSFSSIVAALPPRQGARGGGPARAKAALGGARRAQA